MMKEASYRFFFISSQTFCLIRSMHCYYLSATTITTTIAATTTMIATATVSVSVSLSLCFLIFIDMSSGRLSEMKIKTIECLIYLPVLFSVSTLLLLAFLFTFFTSAAVE